MKKKTPTSAEQNGCIVYTMYNIHDKNRSKTKTKLPTDGLTNEQTKQVIVKTKFAPMKLSLSPVVIGRGGGTFKITSNVPMFQCS